MIEVFKLATGAYYGDISNLLVFSDQKHLRGHKFKLHTRHSRTNIRKNYFGNRVVEPWNSLPAHVVEAPSLGTFERRLDKAWESLEIKFDYTAEPNRKSYRLKTTTHELDTEAESLRPESP
jgi:hypothetical protein